MAARDWLIYLNARGRRAFYRVATRCMTGFAFVARAQSIRHAVKHKAGAVAVVDDDPAVLDSLRFLLEVVGHCVSTYTSAAAFLADRAAKHACLILDHHMPQMTGLELAARLRAAGEAIPVLLITGSPSPAIVARAAELGIEKVLEKPPNEDALLSFVNAHN